MNTTPKKDTIDKASQFGFGLTFKSSNQNDYPVAYQDDIWDVADENTNLKELMGQVGQYDQHTINEELAKEIQAKLTEEDLDEVQVGEFTSNKCTIGYGGTLEFDLGSTIKLKKGSKEAKVVVVSENDTEHELTFPEKTGTIATIEDVPPIQNIFSGQEFDVTSNTDVQRALGAIITALGGIATNVPTT